MLRRRLGQGGPEVSAIGIGAMSFSNFYGPCSEPEAHALLDAARDHGIDHLDTSNIYGMGLSERIIGRYLAARGSERQSAPPVSAVEELPKVGASMSSRSARP